ncbi:MAG: aminotransferase class I/II-fold pyridoxal phosphate-dependent enzyme [bacterium]|nr:aminotransferase class I/II-fold pyridoxal phosphate-dependent enzyme [bacterium]
MKERYYSLREVAALLNVSYMTIYRWVSAGKLKAFQTGRQFRVDPKDLQDFIDRGEKINLASVSNSLSKFIGSGMMDYAYIESRKFDIDLSLGVNPLGCSKRVQDFYEQKAISFSNYSQVISQSLREKIASVYGFTEEEILTGPGAAELLHLCYATFVNPGDEVLIPELTFPPLEFLAILTHAQPIFIPSADDYDLDYKSIEGLMSSKVKMIVLCNPNNPTGRMLNQLKVEEYVRNYPNIIFVIDEANIDFGGISFLPLAHKYNNIVVIRSFSKGFGLAGLRVGFVTAHKDLIYAMRRRQTPFSVNVFAQKFAEVALEDMPFLVATREYAQKERRYLEVELDRLGYTFEKSDSNYLLVKVTEKFKNVTAFIQAINKKNANVVSGDDFKGLRGQYVRLSPRTHEVNVKFVRILEELEK